MIAPVSLMQNETPAATHISDDGYRIVLFVVLTLVLIGIFCIVEYRLRDHLRRFELRYIQSTRKRRQISAIQSIATCCAVRVTALSIVALWGAPVPLLILYALTLGTIDALKIDHITGAILADYQLGLFCMSMLAMGVLLVRADATARYLVRNWKSKASKGLLRMVLRH